MREWYEKTRLRLRQPPYLRTSPLNSPHYYIRSRTVRRKHLCAKSKHAYAWLYETIDPLLPLVRFDPTWRCSRR